MEEIRELLSGLFKGENAEEMNPILQEMMEERLSHLREQNDDPDITPPNATPTVRKIPEGSTVRRRLFAVDGPAETSGNPNIINSVDDVNRMIQQDVDRAARRWNFDVEREEPIPFATWLYPSEEVRKRRILQAEARKRNLEILVTARNKLRKILEVPCPEYTSSLGVLDNLCNALMDDSQEYYAESLQHWNFDFDNKMPAAGAVVWQQVGTHWIGNKPGTLTRLVLYPMETENGENTSISHEELTNEKTDESALNPFDNIEHLLTDHVNAIYGDWKREIKLGIKIATIISNTGREIDRQILEEMRLLQTTNQHHQVTKLEAIGLIRNEYTNEQDEDTESEDTESDDTENEDDSDDSMFVDY